MKKLIVLLLSLVISTMSFAQTKIQLRSTDKAECRNSDMKSLQASFSFSAFEAQDYESDRGTFSWLSLSNTVIGGNEGDPQIPVVNELIAVPVGANPRIEITSYNTNDYRLSDLGIHTLVPRQPSVRKDQRPEDAPFVMNEAAYQSTRGLRSEPQATVNVVGTMRGVQLGKMTIEPVSYDPVNNTLRVFNNIEVTVHFDGANAQATEQLLVDTYSPYFDGIYGMLFNGRAVRDAYSAHPDLYTTPVKMLVVTTSTYTNSTPFQNWLAWKKQKGIAVDVQTVTSSASADEVRSLIQSRYNANHPTFLVIVGDETAVTYYTTYTVSGLSYNPYVSDLQYASIDNDVYHDMFMSRMSVSNTTELGYLVDKILMYEQYTMPDPSYLNNVLLIAGADSNWAPKVGRPTINYAADNYFNTAHGFSNVYKYVTDTYTGCFNYLNSGVGFANYTAHGDIQEWHSPNFTNDNVNSLTNTNKYFWAMGNCCLTCNFGNTSYYPCYGEAMIRAQNKGAFGYIGSVPESYWYEDYYFGVGATSTLSQTPSMSQTTTGVYDFMFDDTQMNTLNSVPFAGNVAVTYAHANSYTSSVDDEYYWRAYQCFGDGSVMPYHTQPAANNVSHASAIGVGMTSFTVNADAGSYVAITKNNEILGVAEVSANGSVDVPVTGLDATGDVMVVVTRQQRQPYIQTIQAVPLNGPYVTIDGYTPNTAHVGDDTELSITFKNIGAAATTGTTTVTLTSGDNNSTIVVNSKTFSSLAPNATTTVSGFKFNINSGVADGTVVRLHYSAVNGSNTWEGDLNITAGEAVLEYQNMTWTGGFTSGQTLTLTAKFKNTGHYQATNAVATMSTTSNNYITINTPSVNVGTIAVDQEVSCQFSVTINANCPETAQIPVTFNLTANGNLSAQGTETLKNACNVIFNLVDSYGDGWNGANLVVSFDDGTASQSLTISSGSSATYTLEIGNNTHVTLTWTSGNYDGECTFTVSYEGDALIFSQTSRPSAGVLYEFDCNCGAATTTYNVTVASSNPAHGTVSGGGEFSYGQTCTVTATPADGYMFTSWTSNNEIVSTAAFYTFTVNSDMNLVANFAEGLMIGDGGDATSTYLPTYNYYKYSLTEQIYTSTELGNAGIISGIAFYNGGSEKTRTLDLYMKSTTKSSFSSKTDWVTVSTSDKVFSGSVTMTADDWTVITLSNPFVYDGTSNVVLVTDDNSGAYTNQPHMACRVFDTSNQAIYVYNDDTNYSPSSPSSYNGTVLSKKNQLLITKEAISTEPVNITVSVSPAQAGTVAGGGEISFGSICTVSVTPASGYLFMGWTENGTVVSSDQEYSFTATADRDLVATFVQAIEIGDFSANNQYIPSYNYYNYSLTQQIYTADEIGAAGTINWIAFYNEGAEKTRTYDFYLKATEKTSFSSNADWITVAASDKVFTGSVTMAEGTWTIINFTTPFVYDGTSNLVLVADDNTGAYTNSPHMTCSVFNTNESQAIYVFNDNTNFDPMSPPTSSSNNNSALSVKNHVLLGIEASEPQSTVTIGLGEGWNWWSADIEITVEELKAALGSNGLSVIAQNGQCLTYDPNEGWSGSLTSIEVGTMYMIQTSAECTISLTGVLVEPANNPITLVPGTNWVGFIGTDETTINEALQGLTPTNLDNIKTVHGVAIYYGPSTGWKGSINTLKPGEGFIYKSKATTNQTFTFPTSKK